MAIVDVLADDLPASYDEEQFTRKSRELYELVEDYAAKGVKWAS
jgi:hypothetical protein